MSDINMPVMDGLTLLARLEGIDRLLKAVIVSAYGDMENIRIAMNRGAFDFITKPIDFQDLEITIDKTIRTITELKQAEQERAELLSLQQELSVAARIQLSILPRDFPAFPDRTEFDVFAQIHPAKQVGGDLYDFFLLDENRLGIVIGDVSGKGVPAAIFMAVTRTLLRATALQDLSAGSCLEYVNSVLVGQSDSAMFVTVFYAILDLRNGELEYAVGGHNPPYLFAPDNVRMLPVVAGLIVGVMGDADYETQRIRLQPGAGILLYTDGITEAENAAGEFFDEQGLEAWLRRSESLPLPELVGGLVNEVRQFAGEHPQADDLTALAVRYLG